MAFKGGPIKNGQVVRKHDVVADNYNKLSVLAHVVILGTLILTGPVIAGMIQIGEAVIGILASLRPSKGYTAKYRLHNLIWNATWIAIGVWMFTGTAPWYIVALVVGHAALLILVYWIASRLRSIRDTSNARMWSKGYVHDSQVGLDTVLTELNHNTTGGNDETA